MRLHALMSGAALILLLAGCSGDSAKKENIEPPTPLTPFEASARVDRIWSTKVGSGVGRSGGGLVPAVAGGRVFAASYGGSVEAYDAATGRLLWRSAKDNFSGGPAASNDLVVAGTIDGALIALNANDGRERWRVRMSSEVIAAPVISEQLVIAVANDGRVHGLEIDSGKVRWALDRSVPLLSLRGNAKPLLSGDRVFVSGANGRVLAISVADGRLLWEHSVGVAEGRTDLERMADLDGRMSQLRGDLFLAGYDSSAVALTGDGGRELWARELSSVYGVAAADDGVYVSAADGAVWALDRRSGGSNWKVEALAHRMLSAPALMSSYVVVGDLEGYVHWLRRDDGAFAARVRLGKAGFGYGLVVVDDVLYALNRDGSLGAFRLGG